LNDRVVEDPNFRPDIEAEEVASVSKAKRNYFESPSAIDRENLFKPISQLEEEQIIDDQFLN
jgi:hypothetical protein